MKWAGTEMLHWVQADPIASCRRSSFPSIRRCPALKYGTSSWNKVPECTHLQLWGTSPVPTLPWSVSYRDRLWWPPYRLLQLNAHLATAVISILQPRSDAPRAAVLLTQHISWTNTLSKMQTTTIWHQMLADLLKIRTASKLAKEAQPCWRILSFDRR